MSLIPASLVHTKDLVRSKQTLKAANGTAIKVLGEVKVRCEVAETNFVLPCLATEQLSEMIIGLEWLEQQKAIWNFSERWIRLQDREFPLYSLPRSSMCRKVAEAQSYVKELPRDIKRFDYVEPGTVLCKPVVERASLPVVPQEPVA